MNVTKVTMHKAFTAANKGNDIAILEVSGGYTLPVYPTLDDGKYSSEDTLKTFKVIG